VHILISLCLALACQLLYLRTNILRGRGGGQATLEDAGGVTCFRGEDGRVWRRINSALGIGGRTAQRVAYHQRRAGAFVIFCADEKLSRFCFEKVVWPVWRRRSGEKKEEQAVAKNRTL